MALLSLQTVSTRYGAIQALDKIDFYVDQGEIVTLIGANGAGKSTVLRSIMQLVKPQAGEIYFDKILLNRLPTHRIAALGIALVPEGRAIFANLTVLENLEMGAFLQKNNNQLKIDLEHVYDLFPRLAERQKQVSGTLSGGEQQMLAIGRALMAHPRLMLLDEPSLGIAPLLVQIIYQAIDKISREGTTILLVEQNANAALQHSHRAYVLETGRIVMEGRSSDLAVDPRVREAYLGEHGG